MDGVVEFERAKRIELYYLVDGRPLAADLNLAWK